ncbi:hypothetical protein CHS0354_030419 [Potamilus streckersoni]|uniref:Uncharacterized protein n=1 Tax=Potamilus streckersoni TaxID=2493646 RepID=A0AAE0S8J0_9BIVA|nr:hypothetical protein CHS0354_030419 [Potamilus streckersoni]
MSSRENGSSKAMLEESGATMQTLLGHTSLAFGIGDNIYRSKAVVTTVDVSRIIGLDLMSEKHVSIDVVNDVLSIGDTVLSVTFKRALECYKLIRLAPSTAVIGKSIRRSRRSSEKRRANISVQQEQAI